MKPQAFCNMFDDFAHAVIDNLRTGGLNNISTFKCQKLKRFVIPLFKPRLVIFNDIKCKVCIFIQNIIVFDDVAQATVDK